MTLSGNDAESATVRGAALVTGQVSDGAGRVRSKRKTCCESSEKRIDKPRRATMTCHPHDKIEIDNRRLWR